MTNLKNITKFFLREINLIYSRFKFGVIFETPFIIEYNSFNFLKCILMYLKKNVVKHLY